jgi:predicted phosphodiesterase
MIPATTRLLCLADLHLGRASGRIPAGLPVPAEKLTPRAAWQNAVVAARRLGVQAVVLAGDVVDSTNDRFEAFGALHDGVRELLECGIRVLAVAGNHDGVALPRLADLVPRFELLGRGGRWEMATIAGPGGVVHLAGWSFPAERFTDDPAAAGLLPRGADGVTVGLLHGDLDRPGGHHAPTSSARLRAADYDAWLLGHVHTPTLDPATRAPGYLGSLVGLDPTETGPRGAWLLEAADGRVRLALQPLAPLRWEVVDVDVSGLEDLALDLPDRVLGALRDRFTAPPTTWGDALAVGVRVRLTGRARDLAGLVRHARSDLLVGKTTAAGGLAVFIDDVSLAVELAHDLATLARGDDTPVALLARRLLALQAGGEDSLLRAARDAAAELDARYFGGLGPRALTDDQLRGQLHQAGLRALDALLAQAEVRSGAA